MTAAPALPCGTYPAITQYIDGQAVEGSGVGETAVRNPATGAELAWVRHASSQDLDAAVAAAARAFDAWRMVSAYERGRLLWQVAGLLRDRADTIATLLTLESGKTLAEARGEVIGSAEVFEWYAEEGRRAYGRVVPARKSGTRFLVTRTPVGPVAAFTPWNFPALTPARKIAGALAAGCSIVIKPSEETPATCLALAQACADAGVPAGAVNVVLGDPGGVASRLISAPAIRKVTFTGSTDVGRSVAAHAAIGLKRVTLELGGHAPVIVCGDVDVDRVAALAVQRKFRNAGQVCVSPTRFYVHASIHDRFVERFAALADQIVVGDGMAPGSQMGPLANARRVAAVRALAADAIAAGAKQHGTRAPRAAGEGFYCDPIVLSNVPDTARILREEPFGPIVPIMAFDDLDAVLARANALPVGLAAYGFANDGGTLLKLSEQLQAGMIGINQFDISTPETPFGGIRDSGYGSEGGIEGLDAYLETRAVHLAGGV